MRHDTGHTLIYGIDRTPAYNLESNGKMKVPHTSKRDTYVLEIRLWMEGLPFKSTKVKFAELLWVPPRHVYETSP